MTFDEWWEQEKGNEGWHYPTGLHCEIWHAAKDDCQKEIDDLKAEIERLKKPKKRVAKISYSDQDMAAANYISCHIELLLSKDVKRDNVKWANDVRLAINALSVDHDELCRVFFWANQNAFWQANILSPVKLRKHFDRLKLEMKNETNTRVNKSSRAEEFHDRLKSRYSGE